MNEYWLQIDEFINADTEEEAILKFKWWVREAEASMFTVKSAYDNK